jgi:hypothetical protein
MFGTARQGVELCTTLYRVRLSIADPRKEQVMVNGLLIIGVILLVLWFLGLVSSYTLGGFVYVALVVGLILVVVSLVPRIRGRR